MKRKERCSKWKGSVKRKSRSNAPGIRVSNIISCYALICSETSCMFYIYIECIDATTQQLLLRLLTGCCYALRSTQLANTLLSLMLRSKIFSSSFQHQPFYAQRSSQLSNIQIRSSLFRHHRCCALRFLLFFLTFYPH